MKASQSSIPRTLQIGLRYLRHLPHIYTLERERERDREGERE